MRHPVQIALQSGVSSRKLQRMSTAKQTTSKLAKNWPSRVFRVIRAQVVEVQIPLYFQGFPCWWAQQDLNLRPNDYESPALTAELRARCHVESAQKFFRNKFIPILDLTSPGRRRVTILPFGKASFGGSHGADAPIVEQILARGGLLVAMHRSFGNVVQVRGRGDAVGGEQLDIAVRHGP